MMRFSNIRIVLYYQILITVLSLIVGSKLKLSMMNRDTLKHISQDISKVIGRDINIHFPPSLGYSGGGGASTGIISCDSTGLSFFIKTANFYSYDMLHAEFIGVSDISKTETIKCPKPIACGTYENTAYAVFEKLSFGGSGSPQLFAQRLAALHRNTSPNGKFGYSINNTIGATFQPNVYCDTWSEFWDKYRLGHMIKLAKRDGAVFPYENEVRQKIYDILSVHNPEPSLVHGDLWSGNQGYLKDGEPCIFDPATYYGDREVDIAMTKLFGSNPKSFYETYNIEYPLPDGYEIRETIYNLYHILNHYVLFGGGYLSQAQSMMGKILKA